DRVPLDVADAGGQRMLHGGQHVLEAVAELMEQRVHLVEGHARRVIADGRDLVAHEVGDGETPWRAANALVHPGAAALLGGPAVWIEIERRDGCAARVLD